MLNEYVQNMPGGNNTNSDSNGDTNIHVSPTEVTVLQKKATVTEFVGNKRTCDKTYKKGHNVNKWLSELNNHFTANGIVDFGQRIAEAICYTSSQFGDARSVVTSIAEFSEYWEEFQENLAEVYNEHVDVPPHKLWYDIINLEWPAGEPIAAYLANVNEKLGELQTITISNHSIRTLDDVAKADAVMMAVAGKVPPKLAKKLREISTREGCKKTIMKIIYACNKMGYRHNKIMADIALTDHNECENNDNAEIAYQTFEKSSNIGYRSDNTDKGSKYFQKSGNQPHKNHFTNQNGKKGKKCYFCHREGHFIEDCQLAINNLKQIFPDKFEDDEDKTLQK